MKRILALILLVLPLVLSGLGSPAHADSIAGIRLAAGMVPGLDEVKVDVLGGSLTVDLDGQGCVNFNPVVVLRSRTEQSLGFVGAFGIFARNHIGKDDFGDEVQLSAFGLSIAPGLSANLSERSHLEFKVQLDVGGAEQSIPGFSDGGGPYAALGLTAGGYTLLNDVIELGVELGYMSFSSTGELDFLGVNQDVTFSGSGLSLNASIGFMF